MWNSFFGNRQPLSPPPSAQGSLSTTGGSTGSLSAGVSSTTGIVFPSAPPNLPTSPTPNYTLSTSTAGATLTGKSTKNNQMTANAANVRLVGGHGGDTFIVHSSTDVVVGNG